MLHMIRRIRRPGALVSITILLLVLAGCSKPAETQAPRFKGSITIWASQGLPGYPGRFDLNWLEEQISAFESAHEGITVEIRTFATGEELEEALLTGSGPKPDLYLGRPLPSLGEGLARLPLKPELADDHHAGAMTAFRRGESAFGLPLLLDLQVLALNEQLFAERGVALPREGWSQTDFAASVGKLSVEGQFALGFSYAPGYHQWWPLIDGLIAADGSIASGAESGLVRLASWRKAGYLYPEIATLSTKASYQLFADKPSRIAMMPIPAWAIPLLRNDPYKATFSVAPFPDGVNVGNLYGVAALATEDGAKLEAMADLTDFLTRPDQQVRLARQTGLMPARKSAPNPFEGDEQMSRAFQMTASFRPLPAGPAWDAARESVAEELLLALYGGRQPAEALRAAKDSIDMATTPGE